MKPHVTVGSVCEDSFSKHWAGVISVVRINLAIYLHFFPCSQTSFITPITFSMGHVFLYLCCPSCICKFTIMCTWFNYLPDTIALSLHRLHPSPQLAQYPPSY